MSPLLTQAAAAVRIGISLRSFQRALTELIRRLPFGWVARSGIMKPIWTRGWIGAVLHLVLRRLHRTRHHDRSPHHMATD